MRAVGLLGQGRIGNAQRLLAGVWIELHPGRLWDDLAGGTAPRSDCALAADLAGRVLGVRQYGW